MLVYVMKLSFTPHREGYITLDGVWYIVISHTDAMDKIQICDGKISLNFVLGY